MAATLRRCGFTKYLLVNTAERTTRFVSLKQVQRKCFHTKSLSCGVRLGQRLPEYKLKYQHMVKIIAVRYSSSETVTVPVAEMDVSSVANPDTVLENVQMPTTTPEGYILDTPPIPLPTGAPEPLSLPDLTVIGEPTLSSLGLAQGYYPTSFYMSFLEFIHASLDIPWWAAVCIVSFTFRLLLVPLFVKSKKTLIQYGKFAPEAAKHKTRVREAKLRGNAYEAELYKHAENVFMKENNFDKKWMFVSPIFQAGTLMTVFWSIQLMVGLPVESLKTGGIGWFTDLTVGDQYYGLPFLTMISMYTMLERGAESVKTGDKPFLAKCLFRGLPILSFFFMSRFSTAIAVHWLTTNVFSILQNEILRLDKVKKLLNMPEEEVKKNPNMKKNFESMLQQYSQYRAQRQLEDRKEVANMTFKEAGEGPVPKTYAYNPNKKKINVKTKVAAQQNLGLLGK